MADCIKVGMILVAIKHISEYIVRAQQVNYERGISWH